MSTILPSPSRFVAFNEWFFPDRLLAKGISGERYDFRTDYGTLTHHIERNARGQFHAVFSLHQADGVSYHTHSLAAMTEWLETALGHVLLLDEVGYLVESSTTNQHIKHARELKDASERKFSGVITGFWLGRKTAEKLSVPDGEHPDDLHVTLTYHGDRPDLEKRQGSDLQTWRSGLQSLAEKTPPLTGATSGHGRFAPAEAATHPVYASIDMPHLSAFRERVVTTCKEAGYVPEMTHGFTPHCTLKYIASDDGWPLMPVPATPLTFSMVHLAYGDDHYLFPLKGTPGSAQ